LLIAVGVGLQWSNINRSSTIDDNFTMLNTLIMLIVDIILYTAITWYFDAVLPGDFGTPQPFYFPFTVVSISFRFRCWYFCRWSANWMMFAGVVRGFNRPLVEDDPVTGDRK